MAVSVGNVFPVGWLIQQTTNAKMLAVYLENPNIAAEISHYIPGRVSLSLRGRVIWEGTEEEYESVRRSMI